MALWAQCHSSAAKCHALCGTRAIERVLWSLRGYCGHQGATLAIRGELWPLQGHLGRAEQPVHHPPHQHPSEHQPHQPRARARSSFKTQGSLALGCWVGVQEHRREPGTEQGWELGSCSSREASSTQTRLWSVSCVWSSFLLPHQTLALWQSSAIGNCLSLFDISCSPNYVSQHVPQCKWCSEKWNRF